MAAVRAGIGTGRVRSEHAARHDHDIEAREGSRDATRLQRARATRTGWGWGTPAMVVNVPL